MKILIVVLFLISIILLSTAGGIKLGQINNAKDYYRILTVLGGIFLSTASILLLIMNRVK